MPREKGRIMVAQNRKARHDYHLGDRFEAGLVLTGTEVKSLRLGRASLADAFATVDDGEVWLRNLHIAEYHHGTWTNHAPRRNRKLLLHRKQIDMLVGKLRDGNFTPRFEIHRQLPNQMSSCACEPLMPASADACSMPDHADTSSL